MSKRGPGRPREPGALRREGGRIAYRVDAATLKAAEAAAKAAGCSVSSVARTALLVFLLSGRPL